MSLFFTKLYNFIIIRQTVEFATVVKDGVVQEVGKSAILQPKTKFQGGSIKWYQDKPKKKNN